LLLLPKRLQLLLQLPLHILLYGVELRLLLSVIVRRVLPQPRWRPAARHPLLQLRLLLRRLVVLLLP